MTKGGKKVVDHLCKRGSKAKRVKVEERGVQATFVNDPCSKYTIYRVDGCLVKESIAADYAVIENGVGMVIVELKGCDVEHGTDQIMASAQYMQDVDFDKHKGNIAGLLVCRRVPAGAQTAVQKQQVRFRREFRANLIVKSGNRDYQLSKLIALG